jgi:hypothetical protein
VELVAKVKSLPAIPEKTTEPIATYWQKLLRFIMLNLSFVAI